MLPENINDLKYVISYNYDIYGYTSHFFVYKVFLLELKFKNNQYFFETYIYSNYKGFINKEQYDYLHYKYETIEIEFYLKSLNIYIEPDFKKTREELIRNIIHNNRLSKINKLIK